MIPHVANAGFSWDQPKFCGIVPLDPHSKDDKVLKTPTESVEFHASFEIHQTYIKEDYQ